MTGPQIVYEPPLTLSHHSASMEPMVEADMRLGPRRLSTFAATAVPCMDSLLLAEAGFFKMGLGDSVQCAFCSGVLNNWERGDDAMAEHKCHFPRCPFMNGYDVGNVPVENDPIRRVGGNYDVCGSRDTVEVHGVVAHTSPKTVGFTSIYSRRLSFAHRQREYCDVDGELMAIAGFKYMGTKDWVQCFHCAGELKDWSKSDDPWEQHSKWFPDCNYMRRVKGDSFITASKRSMVSPTTVLDKNTEVIKNVIPAQNVDIPSKPMCKLCSAAEIGIAFLPCGHAVACPLCAATQDRCPICGAATLASCRIYLA
jgi:baculoviral IAP repeat-containing protein 7/8